MMVLVCPICRRPAKKCSLFARVVGLKFGEDKSEVLRKFHAEPCETCGVPKEECKKRKIQGIIAHAKKKGPDEKYGKHYQGDGGQYIRNALKDQTCKREAVQGEPGLPAWWREKP